MIVCRRCQSVDVFVAASVRMNFYLETCCLVSLETRGKIQSTIGFLGQFRKMSSKFNHQSIIFRTKSNATKKESFDFI